MSKAKKPTKLQKLKRLMMSVFILLIFLVPTYLTVNWMHDVVFGDDPRKVAAIEGSTAKNFSELRPFKEPLISITFDDGWETIYTEAYPLLEKYGIKTTQYILGDEFDNYVYMSEGQLLSLQKSGHEIASHTMTHPNLTQLDDEDLAYELDMSKSILNKKFGKVQDFATPLGAYDDRVIANIKERYRSHRTTDADPSIVDENDVNLDANFNPYNIIAFTVRRTTTLEELNRLINYTEAHNGWLVLTYHQIDDSDAHFGVTKEVFEQHLKLYTSGKSRLPMVGQFLDALTIKQENL